MGTAERKIKEKEELRELILKSARKLFVENGVAQTTIRSIAKNIDYSIGTVYLYFKDKNAILNELHTQGFSELGRQFKVLAEVEDPMERLIAMGRIYLRFAVENPEMYELMFTLKAPMEVLNEAKDKEWNEGQSAFGVLKTTVDQCMARKHFQGHRLEPLTFMIWGLVHGMCSLHISDRANGVKLHDAAGIVQAGYEEFLKILKKL
ncbi:TetR/AcrR family transcriptional regulator [Mucilaginibacter sp. L3T2-6]|uniref:TetR/AcrR family transcriptional regulator n=1 Tax=Mucilaginibacter sp. L3T2-6 TaxID=3062491 RepID=UPI0026748E6D|nr:TetR/AcrR family transcriptional regulator [Mucilaginibacter sp. L3T2-6]MDO3643969.1 TetR/AcrR family transcriptional regulator [Mucilaginibacter sp. L3T2-6]MDV6216308.1 TetR/AcrR family transcriptional regulator [Mucilaginibacter sp. L3T2-6]